MDRMKKTIALLFGGRSGEHEVSLSSAASVAKNLDTSKYEILLIGIDIEGNWYLQDDDELRRIRSGGTALSIKKDENRRVSIIPGGGRERAFSLAGGKALPVDTVFPVLHGTFGEDGTIQGLFEIAGLPYVGCGVPGSAIGMDKEIAKILWLNAGLPVVPYLRIRAGDWKNRDKRQNLIETAERDFSYPLFIKPSSAGSSVGTGVAAKREELEACVGNAFAWDSKVLIEPFIPAREIECSVTGNRDFEAYTPGEVAPTHQFYDYDAKYNDPNGAALLIPADLNEATLHKIRELAVRAYRTAEITGLARVDFFIHKDTGEIYLNELNTMPGFTSISMFPKMCEASGLSYPDLLDKLIGLGEERFAEQSTRVYARETHR
ncbi:D-alanine--D-alanine ligase family protein [Breznakiella homolactica]|uniref:D-alanine--D-alanine ligase n=1 Tax=Breznakiella homolactica TaxID=2798577 RepID=A0A7T7XR04_9SPIR|nr:D-alanine--D-alanine ligase family protein [Breznakiella homolactica]QQO10900.1 D-alanine--D-alanine ligase [Breznakiella homolactica]